MKKIKSASVTPMTPVAVFFTLASLAWTGYSVTDLMAAGPWGLLAAVSVDGLWGVVQFLDYKGIGGRTVRNLGWVALACASGLLAYHGSTINPAAAIAGSLPPIVAKAAWLGDIRLRRDPTALTPGQESEINDVIRDSEYIARMKAAQIRRDAAEEIALVQAQADVTLARDEADFMVGLERLRKRAELERRRPLQLSPAGPHAEPAAPAIAATSEQDREQSANSTSMFASTANTVRDQIANKAVSSPNAIREHDRPTVSAPTVEGEQPSLADLVRDQIANTADNVIAVRKVLALRPDANEKSVAAAVRRARRQMQGPYA